MYARQSQKGATLVVALIMLAVLALLGVTSVNNSTVNLRVTHNMQARQDAEADAQTAIEQVISSIDSFNTPTAQTIALDTHRRIVVSAPVCTQRKPSEGYSATFALAPLETNWEVTATASDDITGGTTNMRQGVAIVLPAGACP